MVIYPLWGEQNQPCVVVLFVWDLILLHFIHVSVFFAPRVSLEGRRGCWIAWRAGIIGGCEPSDLMLGTEQHWTEATFFVCLFEKQWCLTSDTSLTAQSLLFGKKVYPNLPLISSKSLSECCVLFHSVEMWSLNLHLYRYSVVIALENVWGHYQWQTHFLGLSLITFRREVTSPYGP